MDTVGETGGLRGSDWYFGGLPSPAGTRAYHGVTLGGKEAVRGRQAGMRPARRPPEGEGGVEKARIRTEPLLLQREERCRLSSCH